MTLQELITLAEDRDLSKSYVKADGLYIWDYKLQINIDNNFELELVLIPSTSGKVGFDDKVSIQELVNYVNQETQEPLANLPITGVEGITIAKI